VNKVKSETIKNIQFSWVGKSTKERIMDAAIDLFSIKGYEAVSIREIARAVDIRESSIYNHYKGKDELMDTIIQHFIGELSRSDPEETPMEVMLEKYGAEEFMNISASAYLQRLNQPRIAKIWRIISIELFRNDKVRNFFRTTIVEVPIAAWEQIFLKMIELGYIRECDANTLAKEFFYHCIYLYFDCFIISFDESTYETFTRNILEELAPHIKFIFDAVKTEEA